MVIMKEKILGLSVQRVLFNQTQERKYDLSRFMRIDNPVVNNWYSYNRREYTVMTDLLLSEEELLKLMRKKVRYEVNRAEKDGLKYDTYDSAEIMADQELLNAFEQAYMQFAKGLNDKNVLRAYSRTKIERYIRNGCLVISVMSKGNLVVYHVYMYDENEAVLLFSVSDFREDTVDGNLAGRANKLLHYYDMIYFKKMGLHRYDWGNISSIETPNGIDNFKMSFGGEVCEKYNVLIGNTFKGKLLVFLYKCLIRR